MERNNGHCYYRVKSGYHPDAIQDLIRLNVPLYLLDLVDEARIENTPYSFVAHWESYDQRDEEYMLSLLLREANKRHPLQHPTKTSHAQYRAVGEDGSASCLYMTFEDDNEDDDAS